MTVPTAHLPPHSNALGQFHAPFDQWSASAAPQSYPAHQVLAQANAYAHLFAPDFTELDGFSQMQSSQLQRTSEPPLASELNSGIYKTDEFRMYSFKVRRCPKGPAHDWTDCPYCHPGEKAKRRDPLKYAYTGIACPDFRKATCKRGEACPYAHGVFECWLHPSRYRTQLCKDGTACTRSVCFFAHSLQELRPGPLQASLAAEWFPKAICQAPASPNAPPLLSSEEGSPRSLGNRGSPSELELLQNLMPASVNGFTGYGQLQSSHSSPSPNSVYNFGTGNMPVGQAFPNHTAGLPFPQQAQQLCRMSPDSQIPHSQAQAQELQQAMSMLSLGSLPSQEAATKTHGFLPEDTTFPAASQASAIASNLSATQAMLQTPARRRSEPTKTNNAQAARPGMTSPFASNAGNNPAGPGSGYSFPPVDNLGQSALPGSSQWLDFAQTTPPSSRPMAQPVVSSDADWLKFAMLSQSLNQPSKGAAFGQQQPMMANQAFSW